MVTDGVDLPNVLRLDPGLLASLGETARGHGSLDGRRCVRGRWSGAAAYRGLVILRESQQRAWWLLVVRACCVPVKDTAHGGGRRPARGVSFVCFLSRFEVRGWSRGMAWMSGWRAKIAWAFWRG